MAINIIHLLFYLWPGAQNSYMGGRVARKHGLYPLAIWDPQGCLTVGLQDGA